MKYSIGIDIGGTNTVLGLVDSKGKILKTNRFLTSQCEDFASYIEVLAVNIAGICKSIPLLDNEGVLGVGIGAPNGNRYKGIIDNAPNLKYKGILNVKQLLEKELAKYDLNLRVELDNDANAAAMGEMIYGKAQGVKNFIMITLGTGLGSGIVVDGRLVYGHTGFAGEVGHTIIEEKGRLCNCGRRGCVERYCSVSGFTLTAEEKLTGTSQPSLLRRYPKEEVTGELIYKVALQGDELALSCYDYTAKMLAIALANVTAITSPEKIFIFGGLSKSGDLLLKPLKTYFEHYVFDVFKGSVSIELSGLKEDGAAILGAAALVF